MGDMVGLEFRPTDEELVGYYLRNKIEGNSSLVDGAISEVKICSYDPWDLRFQSKHKSKDPMWYFFSRRENKYGNGNRQSRTTRSGKWKLTGDPANVTDQWGISSGFRGKIGYKRVLLFLDGRYPEKTKSDWVIHEFHCDLLPESQEETYVICRLEYKGDDASILLANATDPNPSFVPNITNSAGSVVNQSRQGNSGSYNTYSEYDSANHGQHFNETFNTQQPVVGSFDMQQPVEGNSGFFNLPSEYGFAGQWLSDYVNLPQVPYPAPYENDLDMFWKPVIEENYESLVDERISMQEHYSDYKPKKPVTGFLADDGSDTETGSMIFEDTSSSTDSVGSSNESYHTIDDIPSLNTAEPLPKHEAQEQPKQLKLLRQSKEKVINTQKSECEWKMAEDSIKKPPLTNTVKQSWIILEKRNQRNAQWNHLKNMIVGVVLFISIIGWIILVG